MQDQNGIEPTTMPAEASSESGYRLCPRKVIVWILRPGMVVEFEL